MLNKANLYTHHNENYLAEFISGYLFLNRYVNNFLEDSTMVRLNNERGQNITLGQFNDSCKTHGFDKACEVFWKLGVEQQ